MNYIYLEKKVYAEWGDSWDSVALGKLLIFKGEKTKSEMLKILSSHINKAKSEVLSKLKKVDNSEATLNTFKTQINQTKAQIKKLKKELSGLNDTEKLLTEKNEIKQIIAEKKVELNYAALRIDNLRQRRDELKNQFSNDKKEMESTSLNLLENMIGSHNAILEKMGLYINSNIPLHSIYEMHKWVEKFNENIFLNNNEGVDYFINEILLKNDFEEVVVNPINEILSEDFISLKDI